MTRHRLLLTAIVSLPMVACHTADDRRPRDTRAQDTAVAAELRQAADSAPFRDAADVAMSDVPDSTLPMPPQRRMISHAPRPASSPPARPVAQPTAAPASTRRSASPDVGLARPAAPPIVPRQERSAAPATSPALRGPVAADPTPACASPATADQRRCLMAYLSRSDRGLDEAYQRRISRLRAEAGTPEGAGDPPSVERLRTAQRAWLVYRDTECRNRNRGREGPLWAPVRARCLGEFSQQRATELMR